MSCEFDFCLGEPQVLINLLDGEYGGNICYFEVFVTGQAKLPSS